MMFEEISVPGNTPLDERFVKTTGSDIRQIVGEGLAIRVNAGYENALDAADHKHRVMAKKAVEWAVENSTDAVEQVIIYGMLAQTVIMTMLATIDSINFQADLIDEE